MQNDHYFSANPTSSGAKRQVDLYLDDMALTLETDRSMFSPERIDPGTHFLLAQAPRDAEPSSRIADVGCGYGPIACCLARRHPRSEVIAVDINHRALDLCKRNAAALQLHNLTVVHADHLDPAARFDQIWSNPPIRIGKPALHELMIQWLNRLNAHGVAYFVVNKNLGADSLQRWLDSLGYTTTRLGSRQAYRILEVIHGASTVAN